LLALVASTTSSTALFFLVRVVGALDWMTIAGGFRGKGKKRTSEHRSGIGFSRSISLLLLLSLQLLTFTAAAFFADAAAAAAVMLLFVALVATVLAPESRSRASERC